MSKSADHLDTLHSLNQLKLEQKKFHATLISTTMGCDLWNQNNIHVLSYNKVQLNFSFLLTHLQKPGMKYLDSDDLMHRSHLKDIFKSLKTVEV